MLTTVILGSVAILLTGFVAMIHSARHAVTGYEDDSGFHEGIDPRAENAFVFLADCAKNRRQSDDAIIVREAHSFVHAPVSPVGNPSI